jgi:hypothetical protein
MGSSSGFSSEEWETNSDIFYHETVVGGTVKSGSNNQSYSFVNKAQSVPSITNRPEQSIHEDFRSDLDNTPLGKGSIRVGVVNGQDLYVKLNPRKLLPERLSHPIATATSGAKTDQPQNSNESLSLVEFTKKEKKSDMKNKVTDTQVKTTSVLKDSKRKSRGETNEDLVSQQTKKPRSPNTGSGNSKDAPINQLFPSLGKGSKYPRPKEIESGNSKDAPINQLFPSLGKGSKYPRPTSVVSTPGAMASLLNDTESLESQPNESSSDTESNNDYIQSDVKVAGSDQLDSGSESDEGDSIEGESIVNSDESDLESREFLSDDRDDHDGSDLVDTDESNDHDEEVDTE